MTAYHQTDGRHANPPDRTVGGTKNLRSFAKHILYASGVLRAWHRRRNRDHLTVVMFHRVLPPEDARFAGSNPAYTIEPDELDQCLSLFKRFYNIVSTDQVAAARAGGNGLPRCPLLITFDDGWQDNFEYALPVLKRHGLPALLFVATGYIGSEKAFWQEEVLDAVLTHRISTADAAANGNALITALREMPRQQREAFLAKLPGTADLPRRMADASELTALRDSGVAIGGHGHLHEPLTELENANADFVACRDSLRGLKFFDAPTAFSFPHGRFDAKLAALARAAGFDPLFTSKHALTPCADLPVCETIGRIEMDLRAFRLSAGRLDEAMLMSHLVTQLPQAGRPVSTNSNASASATGGADAVS